MGIHSGVPLSQTDPVTGRMDYFGKVVNKCARISSVALGGQLLVSDTVWEEIQKDPVYISTVKATPLGSFTFKGIKEETAVVQVF